MTDAEFEMLMRANLMEVFAERDAETRRTAIDRTYTEDVVFADSEGEVHGREALSAKAQEILDGAPGFAFRIDGDFYRVQDMGYLAWALGPAGEAPVVRGADMGLLRDGLLARVYTVLFH